MASVVRDTALDEFELAVLGRVGAVCAKVSVDERDRAVRAAGGRSSWVASRSATSRCAHSSRSSSLAGRQLLGRVPEPLGQAKPLQQGGLLERRTRASPRAKGVDGTCPAIGTPANRSGGLAT